MAEENGVVVETEGESGKVPARIIDEGLSWERVKTAEEVALLSHGNLYYFSVHAAENGYRHLIPIALGILHREMALLSEVLLAKIITSGLVSYSRLCDFAVELERRLIAGTIQDSVGMCTVLALGGNLAIDVAWSEFYDDHAVETINKPLMGYLIERSTTSPLSNCEVAMLLIAFSILNNVSPVSVRETMCRIFDIR